MILKTIIQTKNEITRAIDNVVTIVKTESTVIVNE